MNEATAGTVGTCSDGVEGFTKIGLVLRMP